MIRAYLAGAYRAPTPEGISANIALARTAAQELWRCGYAVLSPHCNTALFDGVVSDEQFLEGDIAWLRCADVMVLMPGWEKSEGTRQEIVVAQTCGIPVMTLGEAYDAQKVQRRIAGRERARL